MEKFEGVDTAVHDASEGSDEDQQDGKDEFEAKNVRSVTNYVNNCRGFVRGAVRELDGPNLRNVVMVGVKGGRQGRTKVGVHHNRRKSNAEARRHHIGCQRGRRRESGALGRRAQIHHRLSKGETQRGARDGP